MANDIASLGLNVESDSVKQAADDLDRLSSAGASAERSATKASDAWSSAAAQMSKAGAPAKQAAQSFGHGTQAIKDQQVELAKLLGKIDPVVAALGRLDGMEEQLRKHRASGLLGSEDFNVYAQKIQAMRNALGGADDQLARTGNTAKQTAQALRLLPAQFTDIAVGLQAGQSPFTVLLQQGGQIKDQFGGIGPAFSAVGRYALSLVNPFTLAAAAVGALALAYKQGSDEQTAYAKALIITGNAAGTTTDQLAGMAKQVSGTVGTTSQAADALTQLAATGKIAQDQLQGLATAAVAWEKATGTAVSQTVAEFAKLADDPVKASQQLNEQYNYLTQAVFEQISALQEQGRQQDAAKLAEDAYASALRERSTQIEQNLGTLERAWDAVKSAAAGAWDAALNVGREETLDAKIARLKQQLQEVATAGSVGVQGRGRFQLGLGGGGEGDLRQQLTSAELLKEEQDGLARFKAESAQVQKDGIAATQQIISLRESMLSKEERKQKEIAGYWSNVAKARAANPFTNMFSDAQIKKDLDNIDAKYAEHQKKTAAPKAYQDDAATRMLQSLREQGAELQAQLSTQDKLTASQKAQAQFAQLIADLKGKAQLTADQKSLLANQDAIKAQLAKNVAIDQEIQKRQQLAQIQSYQDALNSKLDTEKQGYQQQLEGIGKGSELRQRLREQLRIQQDYQRDLARLQSQYNRGQISEEQYRQETDLLNKSLDDRLKAWDDYYKKLKEKQKDWTNGAKDAFQDYVDDSKNAAKTYYDLFKNALQGTEDALTKFVMTGKLSFSDLANSIIEDLVRIQVRKAIAFGIESFQGSALAADLFGSAQANGGAWLGGAQMFATGGAFTNGIVSSPTVFGMRNGRLGVMGEAGPEAIMPLQRTPDGALGVRVAANDSAVSTPSENHYHFNFPNVTSAEEAKQATAVAARNFGRTIARLGRYS